MWECRGAWQSEPWRGVRQRACMCASVPNMCARPHGCEPVLSALARARGCVERLSVGKAGMAETLHSSFSPNRATWVVGELNGAALALRSPADSHQI